MNIPTLSTIKNQTEKITHEYGELKLEVTFLRGFWTPELEANYLDSDERYAIKNIPLFCSAVIAVEFVDKNDKRTPLKDDDGNLVKIVPEVIVELDKFLINGIVTEMINKVNPNSTNSQD